MEEVNAHLKHAYEQEFGKAKQRQTKKLKKKLIKRKNSDKQTHIAINEKLLRNLSKRTITKADKAVLTKGLNYAITPRKIPQDKYILATELACHKIQDQ